MDNRNFMCFDFETSSTDTQTTQILQIGACIIDRNSLEIKESFESLVRPESPDDVQSEALKVNGLTLEQLEDAPEIDVIFPTFAKWIKKFNVYKNKSSFGSPVGMTYNGTNFDMPIFMRYCKRFGYWDSKWCNQNLVNPIYSFDVLQHIWFWTRTMSELPNLKLVTVLEYMGVKKEEIERGAHNALWDVHWTARIGVKLLRVGNYLTQLNDVGKRRLEMKNCFKDN